MDLAIINCSHDVVAWGKMRIAPGGKVRLSSYYTSEENARQDLTLMKFVNAGKLKICPVDFVDPSALAEMIASLEAKADAEQAQAQAARRLRTKQARERRADHQVARQASRAQERAKREQQAEQKAELDLGALFETSRKQRLTSVMREREDRTKLQQAKLEELAAQVVSQPPPEVPVEQWAETLAEDLVHETKPQVEESAPVALEVEQPQAEPEAQVDLPEQEESQPEEAATGSIFLSGKVSRIDLETLSEGDLRSLLDQFDVKGREKIKKHASLVNAVEKLGLMSVDLAQMLPAKE